MIEGLEPLPYELLPICKTQTRKQLYTLLTHSALVSAFVNEFDKRNQANLSAGYIAGAAEENSHVRLVGDFPPGYPISSGKHDLIIIPQRNARARNPEPPISYDELQAEVRRIRIALRLYRHAWATLAAGTTEGKPISVSRDSSGYRALAALLPEQAIEQLNAELTDEFRAINSPSRATTSRESTPPKLPKL